MRNSNDLLNTFTPAHEKEWEARLFIDQAIKNSTEFHLETLARALSGKHVLNVEKAHNEPFEKTEHIESDEGQWIKKTKKYKWKVSFSSFVLFGVNKIDIWLKVIDFWAGKEFVFPCGGAFEGVQSKEESII